MCPWPPLQPDLPSRPTSPDPPRPAHAIWYSGNFEQKRLRGLNVRKKWNQTYRKPCEPQDVSIYTHLLNINLVSFYILYYDIGHPQHNLKRNSILFYFILFYVYLIHFHHFWTINMNKNNATNLSNFHQFCILSIPENCTAQKCPRTKYNNVNNV